MTVKVIYDEVEQLGVPESSITIQGNTHLFMLLMDEKVEKKNIEIGKRNFGKVSVLSGVQKVTLVD